MIYFDNAATGGFKPRAVTDAAQTVIRYLSANPGRSGHRLSVSGAGIVYDCRNNLANLFSAKSERVIFTKNCTEALNTAKEILAYELTKLVHGEEEAKKADEAAKALFGGAANSDNMPTTTLSADDFTDGAVSLIDIMLKAEIIKSRGEGRRLIEQGGVTVDDEKAKSFTDTVALSAFEKGYVIVKKGKKVFVKFIVE